MRPVDVGALLLAFLPDQVQQKQSRFVRFRHEGEARRIMVQALAEHPLLLWIDPSPPQPPIRC